MTGCTTGSTGTDSSGTEPCTSVDAIIGAEGGTLRLGDLELTVPPGALADAMTLSAGCESSPLPEGMEAQSPIYVLEPEGTVFALPVSVSITAPGAAPESAIFWSARDRSDELELAPTTRDGDTFTAEGMHFSIITLALSRQLQEQAIQCYGRCLPTQRPCRSRIPAATDQRWCPGDAMPQAGEGAELNVYGGSSGMDQSRLEDLRQAVHPDGLEAPGNQPPCLASLRDEGFRWFDPLTRCAPQRNMNEASWVTPVHLKRQHLLLHSGGGRDAVHRGRVRVPRAERLPGWLRPGLLGRGAGGLQPDLHG